MMSSWRYTLQEGDYVWASGIRIDEDVEIADANGVVWLKIDTDGLITISRGYAWDGCSPTCCFLDLGYLGTPDGTVSSESKEPKTYYASLVHDALYQFLDHPDMPFTRQVADTLFYDVLGESGFKLRIIYFCVVRMVGGFYRRLFRWLRGE